MNTGDLPYYICFLGTVRPRDILGRRISMPPSGSAGSVVADAGLEDVQASKALFAVTGLETDSSPSSPPPKLENSSTAQESRKLELTNWGKEWDLLHVQYTG